MNTLTHSSKLSAQSETTTMSIPKLEPKWLTDLLADLERNRLAVVPTMLLPLLCLSGVAAGLGAQGDLIKLIIVLAPNIFPITFTLALSPVRWIAWAFLAAIVADIAILAIA